VSPGKDTEGSADAGGETLLAGESGQGIDLGPKFDVLETVGRGGMGTVLKVRHRAMDRVRAVKLLHLEDATRDPELIERFRREATVASDLSHPNIVQIYDFDHTPKGEPYIAMEFLEGADLHQLLKREGPLDLGRTVELLTGVADALDRVHELGVVHRDLKPANLFVTRDGTVKILDFGISHVEWEGPSLTQTGDVLGTPMYMSPEQLRGDKVDSRADVYALGAVAYELLTGHQPIEATNPAMLVAKILEAGHKRASEWDRQLPDHVADALARAMAKEPDQRFSTAGELIRALAGPDLMPDVPRASAAADPRLSSPDRATVPMVHRPRRRLVFFILGAVISIAAATWAIFGRDGGTPAQLEAEAAGAIRVPLLVLPTEVDLTDVDDDWFPGAVARLIELHLGLEQLMQLVSSSEAANRVGPSYTTLGSRPTADKLADLGRVTGAKSVLASNLTRDGKGLLLQLTVYDPASGKQIWTHQAAGAGFEGAVEAATWALGQQSLLLPLSTERVVEVREGCGSSIENCRLAMMAETAILELGLFERASRLSREMAPDPAAGFWGALARVPELSLGGQHHDFLADAALGDPPAQLSGDRARLWQLLASFGQPEADRSLEPCDLIGSRDHLARGIATLINDDAGCEGLTLASCKTTDVYLDRLLCLSYSAMHDEAAVALRYWEEFAERDLASKLPVATFSMLPMGKDLDLARRWLDRARLRHRGDDENIANSIVRIEIARRNPTEALVWARKSINSEAREGTVHLLGGRFFDGIELVWAGFEKMVGEHTEPRPYLLDLVVRPAVQPVLLTGSAQLAQRWIAASGGDSSPNRLTRLTVELAEAVMDEKRAVCRGFDPADQPLGIELLFHCERWQQLLDEARHRSEVGYGKRASQFFVAEAHLRLGNLKDAEAGFQAVDDDLVSRYMFPVASLITLERLGRLAAKRGDDDAARRYYFEFLRLWDETDVPIAEVDAAREALERLEK
jgi:hypothetical protein